MFSVKSNNSEVGECRNNAMTIVFMSIDKQESV